MVTSRIEEEADRKEILSEIKTFSDKYNLLSVLETKYGPLTHNNLPRFCVLIKDCIDKASKEELNSEYDIAEYEDTILNLVEYFNELIQTVDGLLDAYFIEKSYDNLEKFIEKTSRIALIPWQSQKYLKRLPFDVTKNIIQNLMNLREAARMEVHFRKNPTKLSENRLMEFTEQRNGDFFLFFSFLTPFLERNFRSKVILFLKRYVLLDNMLDDISDVYQDYKDQAFNVLLWKLQSQRIKLDFEESKDLKNALIRNGIYDFVYDLAIQNANLATLVFEKGEGNFVNYLKFLVQGCILFLLLSLSSKKSSKNIL